MGRHRRHRGRKRRFSAQARARIFGPIRAALVAGLDCRKLHRLPVAAIDRRCRARATGVAQKARRAQLRDQRERFEIGQAAVLDDLLNRAPPVEEPEHGVDRVGNLVQVLREPVVVDLEDLLHRRKLLGEAASFVDAAHALEQQRLVGDLYRLAAADRLELDGKLAVVPQQQAVDRALAGQAPELRVDHLAVAEVDSAAFSLAAVDLDDARLARELDGLHEIDHRHVAERALKACARVSALDPLALRALQNQPDARADLFDVDGLREVVLDAELEAAHLVLDGGVRREEEERNLSPVGMLLEAAAKLEAVEAGQLDVGDDHLGRLRGDARERIGTAGGRLDDVAVLLEVDLEQPQALGVPVDE